MSDDILLRTAMKPFEPFLEDPDITEILINKPQEVVVRSNKARGWIIHPFEILTHKNIKDLINLIAAFNNKPIEQVMSLKLMNGERAQISHLSACEPNYYGIAFRKHTDIAFTIDQLIEQGAFDLLGRGENKDNSDIAKQNDEALLRLNTQSTMKAFFELAIKQRRNIVVAGKTGSGKTTITRSLIDLIPIDERIITIEDVHELKMERHINKTHLIFGKGAGRVSSTEQLANCMRLSPDRILLAELRGGEAWDYIQSLSSGHPGSITSVHSNSAEGAFDRITGFLLQSEAGSKIPYDALKDIVKRVIDVVVYVDNRKVLEVYFKP